MDNYQQPQEPSAGRPPEQSPEWRMPERPAPPDGYHNGGRGYYQPRRKKRVWPWVALGVAALISLSVWMAVAGREMRENIQPSWREYIAVLPVNGVIAADSESALWQSSADYHHQFSLDTLDMLMADANNQALLLYIDSPGGEVLAVDELALKVQEYREYTGRPVFAYGASYAASGGYWVAAAADRIILNRFCVTGSIGITYGTMLDFSGLLERYGVQTYTITSGENKSMGSSFEPLSAEAEAIFQGIIDEYYGYFLEWVAARRDMGTEKLRPLADGRVYTASQAVSCGLADATGTYEQAVAELKSFLGGDCEVIVYEPAEPETNVADLLRLLNGSANLAELSLLTRFLPPTGPLAYYGG